VYTAFVQRHAEKEEEETLLDVEIVIAFGFETFVIGSTTITKLEPSPQGGEYSFPMFGAYTMPPQSPGLKFDSVVVSDTLVSGSKTMILSTANGAKYSFWVFEAKTTAVQ
jgi:hypothetical protein